MSLKAVLGMLLLLAVGAAAQVPPPPTIKRSPPPTVQTPGVTPETEAVPQGPFTISHYDLKLSFNFPAHELEATAVVTLTPNQPLSNASFHLNQNLQVKSVTDASGNSLGQGRQTDQVIVTFPAPVAPGTATKLTFTYGGSLADARLSPISGIRTAYVGEDGAFLLYPGEWFPTAGYGTDRFTATVDATLPESLSLIASGATTSTPGANGATAWHVEQAAASFPGSVIVTALKPATFQTDGLASAFYFGPDVPVELVGQYATEAGKIFSFLTNTYGTPPPAKLAFVELPTDAMPSFSSPGVIVLSKGSIGTAVNTNLLVDEIAQQWFGNQTSPASLNDAWLQYGAARYSEALYVEQAQGQGAWKDLVQQLEVGALSYPDTALSHSSQLYVFSPEFQDLNYDKGALLFHMLRWQLGSQPFNNALRTFVNDYAGKAATTVAFEQSLEKSTQSDLRSFFSQWYQGTSVPTFTNSYTVYRVQKGGYRVTGKIQQDLDLFNMPVQVAVTTDTTTETRTVPVSGTSSDFSVDTQGRPIKVTVDPDDWILKSTPGLKLKVALSRGDNLVAAGDFAEAVKQYRAALTLNPISSLAHYRLAEAYYQEQNWQDAANEYRQAMNGDLDPAWVAVWSHIQLGKIFDMTGQRDRALNEYQLAVSTHDDTNGAQEIARGFLKTPYKPANGPNGQ